MDVEEMGQKPKLNTIRKVRVLGKGLSLHTVLEGVAVRKVKRSKFPSKGSKKWGKETGSNKITKYFSRESTSDHCSLPKMVLGAQNPLTIQPNPPILIHSDPPVKYASNQEFQAESASITFTSEIDLSLGNYKQGKRHCDPNVNCPPKVDKCQTISDP